MVSLPASPPVYPHYTYVRLAKSCKELISSSSEGSRLVREKQCHFCDRIIKLGAGVDNDFTLIQHMLSADCQEQQSKLELLHLRPLVTPHIPNPPLPFYSQTCRCTANGPSQSCPGALVDYNMSVFCNYPLHLHAPGVNLLDYDFSFIDPQGQYFFVRSHKCAGVSPGKGSPCKACAQVVLSRQFLDLVKRADPNETVPPSTNIIYRTYHQVCESLKEKNSKINNLKLKKTASERQIHSLRCHMDDHKRLMLAISESDDTAVGRIIQTALRNGAGVETIINRITRAQSGLFHRHGYSQKLFDLGVLIYKVGGVRLGFSVAKALNLPSVSTIRSRLDLPHLQPCIGFPAKAELMTNIASFFGHDSTQLNHSHTGFSLMIDEIAIEPRLRYSIQQDAVIGGCREHVEAQSMGCLGDKDNTLESLLNMQAGLNTGDFHRATEATMAGLARFGSSDYNPVIVLASGTCKAEKAVNQLRWIDLIIQSWKESPFGETLHGPIWSISTDGDAKRRLALFQLCMQTKLSSSSKLYPLIGRLPLLNLFCGPSLITNDGDYKHIEKRLASAMRSRSGLLVNGAHITPKMLVSYLRCLDNLPESRILSFFDGTDPQNVPKANSLINHLFMASQLPLIASRPENIPFTLLGKVLGSFVQPFTVPSMSLSSQITSLSKCGHLLYSLYRTDGAKFLPGQLVYDMQATIKNVVFCVAKTQLINPALPFYILQVGTDRLEGRFGTYRTTTNDRNGNLLQMCERAASAQHIDEIYSAHPSWNRTPYRLSLDGRSGVDHTNPTSWTGDVTVGNTDLYACWLRGQSQAANTLKSVGIEFEFDPTRLEQEIDLMRPNGIYPGIQVDANEPNLTSVLVAELADNTNASTLDLCASGSPDQPTDSHNPLVTSSKSEAGQHLGDDELNIEHLLSASTDTLAAPNARRGWIFIKGKPVHLESAVRLLLGADGGAKSTDRLRRVCGFTRHLYAATASAESNLGNDFRVSDLVATFVQADNRVALVIIRVTNIVASDGRILESISTNHFLESGITLSGQPLELGYDSESDTWYWTKQYDTVASATTSAHRKRGTGFDFAACLACPVNPELIERGGVSVWSFKHSEMKSIMDELWNTCSEHCPKETLPVCTISSTFPYRTHNDQVTLFHDNATQALQQKARPAKADCLLCNEHNIKIKHDMRIHVGRHLLASRLESMAGTTDASKIPPCGFCGRVGRCETRVERQHNSAKAVHVISNCDYRDDFSYVSASKPSKTNPCTNRPIQCPRCPPESQYIWSYNLRSHVDLTHGSRTLLEIVREVNNYEPSDKEYEFMRVDRKTGLIQPLSRGKRKREISYPDDRHDLPHPSIQRRE